MNKKLIWISLLVLFTSLCFQLMAQPEPVDPVNWRKLTPFLVMPEDWQPRGDVNGSTVNTGSFKMSTVEQDFVKNGLRLQMQIIDGGYVPMAYAGFKAMSQFEIDTSDEYVKKTTIQGFTAIQNIKFKSKLVTIMILVADRFMVQLELRGTKEIKVLKTIAEDLDLKRLAALAK
jgi:hypothetical protein